MFSRFFFRIAFIVCLVGASVFADEGDGKKQSQPTEFDIIGIAAETPSELLEAENKIAEAFQQASQENPNGKFQIANLGSSGGNSITEAILERSNSPIQDLTPTETKEKEPESRADKIENWSAALIRGSVGGVVTSLTFVHSSQNVSGLSIVPAGIALAVMSGGIQINLDDFQWWAKNGSWSNYLYPKFKPRPDNLVDLVKWKTNLKKWQGREFFVKWFLAQFAFLIVIDVALIPTGVWRGQALYSALMKTFVNSLFLLYAEGTTEGAIIDATAIGKMKETHQKRSAGELTDEEEKRINRKYKRLRRVFSGLNAVTCTAIGALRTVKETTWGVFVPNDPAGATIVAIGAIGVVASRKLAVIRERLSCAYRLAPLAGEE